jgi:hypothetical protein
MEQSDIDPTGTPRIEPGVERLPGTAERLAREHALAKHRAAERLRLADEGADDVAIIDDVCG